MAGFLTELVGTFFLTLTIGLVVVAGLPAGPIAIGSVLMALVYMGWHVSGAQYNPAVTLALVVRGDCPAPRAVGFIGAQLLGAAAAAFAVAHITGGGLVGNLPRVLPTEFGASVDTAAWRPPPIFGEIQRLGDVAHDEMHRVFNMGIGMVVVVAAPDANRATSALGEAGIEATPIGVVSSDVAGVILS